MNGKAAKSASVHARWGTVPGLGFPLRAKVDLTSIIHQAVRQMCGSDEQIVLKQWMTLNAGKQQFVTITLYLNYVSEKEVGAPIAETGDMITTP
jgi:hypothetical protein